MGTKKQVSSEQYDQTTAGRRRRTAQNFKPEKWMKDRATKSFGGPCMSTFVQYAEQKRLERIKNTRSSITKSMTHDPWTKRTIEKRHRHLKEQQRVAKESMKFKADDDMIFDVRTTNTETTPCGLKLKLNNNKSNIKEKQKFLRNQDNKLHNTRSLALNQKASTVGNKENSIQKIMMCKPSPHIAKVREGRADEALNGPSRSNTKSRLSENGSSSDTMKKTNFKLMKKKKSKSVIDNLSREIVDIDMKKVMDKLNVIRDQDIVSERSSHISETIHTNSVNHQTVLCSREAEVDLHPKSNEAQVIPLICRNDTGLHVIDRAKFAKFSCVSKLEGVEKKVDPNLMEDQSDYHHNEKETVTRASGVKSCSLPHNFMTEIKNQCMEIKNLVKGECFESDVHHEYKSTHTNAHVCSSPSQSANEIDISYLQINSSVRGCTTTDVNWFDSRTISKEHNILPEERIINVPLSGKCCLIEHERDKVPHIVSCHSNLGKETIRFDVKRESTQNSMNVKHFAEVDKVTFREAKDSNLIQGYKPRSEIDLNDKINKGLEEIYNIDQPSNIFVGAKHKEGHDKNLNDDNEGADENTLYQFTRTCEKYCSELENSETNESCDSDYSYNFEDLDDATGTKILPKNDDCSDEGQKFEKRKILGFVSYDKNVIAYQEQSKIHDDPVEIVPAESSMPCNNQLEPVKDEEIGNESCVSSKSSHPPKPATPLSSSTDSAQNESKSPVYEIIETCNSLAINVNDLCSNKEFPVEDVEDFNVESFFNMEDP
mmetsp:Transcript_17164/g.24267  ORF Transcript_17164/g.24267 Transcript_17164/m.24267 type:complete len:770 (-) Transcript_17164:154-2463(-)